MKKHVVPAIIILVTLLPWKAEAARLFFGGATETAPGGTFEVRVSLDTEEETINVFGGKVEFANATLLKISEGGSMVNFWIEYPKAEGNTISFAGMTPGGFYGKRGLLFSAIFRSEGAAMPEFGARDLVFLKNDGIGSQAAVQAVGVSLSPVEAGAEKNFFVPEDNEPPESFSPQISRNELIFGNAYFVSFSTQDKASGISGYFVAESRSRLGKREWIPAESPYLLRDQELGSYVYVKAVDNGGNEKVEYLRPLKESWYWSNWFWTIIIVSMAILGFGYLSWKKK